MTNPAHEASISYTVKTQTPDGTLFTTVIEELGAPRQVILTIGKSGFSLQAWADALARAISLALRSGLSLQAVISEVSNISTDRKTFSNGAVIRSGPEGVAYALLQYIAEKGKGIEHERPSTLEG